MTDVELDSRITDLEEGGGACNSNGKIFVLSFLCW